MREQEPKVQCMLIFFVVIFDARMCVSALCCMLEEEKVCLFDETVRSSRNLLRKAPERNRKRLSCSELRKTCWQAAMVSFYQRDRNFVRTEGAERRHRKIDLDIESKRQTVQERTD